VWTALQYLVETERCWVCSMVAHSAEWRAGTMAGSLGQKCPVWSGQRRASLLVVSTAVLLQCPATRVPQWAENSAVRKVGSTAMRKVVHWEWRCPACSVQNLARMTAALTAARTAQKTSAESLAERWAALMATKTAAWTALQYPAL